MTLDSFCRWFLDQPVKSLTAAEVYDFGAVKSVVIHRDPPFQVELFTVRPGPGAKDPHRHPNVDSIEVSVSGTMSFIVNGRAHDIEPDCMLHVGPKDWHSTNNLPFGAAFYSVQKWHSGVVMSSVGLDWEGTITSLAGMEHLKLVRERGRWFKVNRRGAIYAQVA